MLAHHAIMLLGAPGPMNGSAVRDAGIAAGAQQERHVRGPLAKGVPPSSTRRISSRAPPGLGMNGDGSTYPRDHPPTDTDMSSMWSREGLGNCCSSLHLRLAPLPALHVVGLATERQGRTRFSVFVQVHAGWAAPSGSRRRYVALSSVISAAWEVRLTPCRSRLPIGKQPVRAPQTGSSRLPLPSIPPVEGGPPQPAPKQRRPTPRPGCPVSLCYRAFPASATTPELARPLLAFGETALRCPCIEENFSSASTLRGL